MPPQGARPSCVNWSLPAGRGGTQGSALTQAPHLLGIERRSVFDSKKTQIILKSFVWTRTGASTHGRGLDWGSWLASDTIHSPALPPPPIARRGTRYLLVTAGSNTTKARKQDRKNGTTAGPNTTTEERKKGTAEGRAPPAGNTRASARPSPPVSACDEGGTGAALSCKASQGGRGRL